MEGSEAVAEIPSSVVDPSAENAGVSTVTEEIAAAAAPTADADMNVDAVTQDAAQSVDYESKPSEAEGAVGAVGAGENSFSHGSTAGFPAHSVGYDAANGNAAEFGGYQAAGAMENGIPSAETGVPAAEQQFEEGNLIYYLGLFGCRVNEIEK